MSAKLTAMPPRLTDGLEKPKSIREVPRYLWLRFKGFFTRLFYIISLVWEAAPAILITMVLLCLLDGFLPVIGAYISRDILNKVAALIGADSMGNVRDNLFVVLQPLLFLFLVEFIYLFVKRVMNRVNTMVTAIAGELVVNHIKLKIICKAKDVDLRSFDNPGFYEKLENANREASMRPINILHATFNVISAVISVVSFVIVLFTLSPIAPLIILGASVPGAIVNYFYRNRNFRYMRFHSKERREMNYYSGLMVNKDLAKEVKILGLGDTFIEKYKKVFRRYYAGLKSLIVKEGITQVLVSLVSMLANCALFAYVAYHVVFDNGMIGDYSLYSGALNSIAGYVSTVVTATATIYEGTLFIDNMIDFLHEDVTVVPNTPTPLVPVRGAPHTVEFRDVSFQYPGVDHYVLRHINLTFRPGESVVLVGLNGAGKTTLIKLLTRLYDPTEGAVYLDGHDLREYDLHALYDMYGIIFQDFGKYAETVRENIRYGDVDRPFEEEAIREAALHGSASGFIGDLPDGYDTPLTRMFEENGIELSGGQWQKLSIARAFYKDSDILILDEPTAALDPMAEQDVFNRFAELSQDKITLFVSHRLSSAVTASQIVVLDGGTVAEVGTHAELMEQKGKYYTLFTTQASRYMSETDDSHAAYAARYMSEQTDSAADAPPRAHRPDGYSHSPDGHSSLL